MVRPGRTIVLAPVLVAALAVPARALEVQIREIRVDAMVRAAFDIRDLLPDRFRKVLDDNGTLHLRLQVELWESRPVWDRLVYPAVIRVVRVTRDQPPPESMPVDLEIGKSDRIVATGRYYLHVIATIGTLAERDADTVGDAVFGRESEANGLGSLGRLVVRTALQINDYLQSVSAEAKSRGMTGAELRKSKP
ncbi:MAG TPA: hypothetical protein VF219_11430 [Vicinamibacterales bacterium]